MRREMVDPYRVLKLETVGSSGRRGFAAWLHKSQDRDEDEPNSAARGIAGASAMAAPASGGIGGGGKAGAALSGEESVRKVQLKIR